MKSFLDSIPQIYVINLDHRTDRWDEFKKRWEPYLDFSKVVRISAVYGSELSSYGKKPWFTDHTGDRAKSWAGAAGCVLSHRRVIEIAQQSTHDYVLVLEDDACPSQFFSMANQDRYLSQFIGINNQWGICYLGFNGSFSRGIPMHADKNSGFELWKVHGALATHAYLVNRNVYHTLLQYLPTEENVWSWIARYRAIDTWLQQQFSQRTHLNVLICIPQLVIQSDSFSDIGQHVTTNLTKDLSLRPRAVSAFTYWLGQTISAPFVKLGRFINETRKYTRSKHRGLPGKKK
ncbi:MAG: glycosyltransferase family 25 protein [Akkermansia sp.]